MMVPRCKPPGETSAARHEARYYREGGWKALRLDIRKNGKLETELYNLAEDPGETRNRAAEHPDIVARLEGLMREARTPSEPFPFPELDAE
ncbi:MAG: hypothetical protein KF886_15050 [Candidatus Hydrogenedentes bacterium]|nr:hypothetical protein [Candidatus Hydrogenedentota bacterium]